MYVLFNLVFLILCNLEESTMKLAFFLDKLQKLCLWNEFILFNLNLNWLMKQLIWAWLRQYTRKSLIIVVILFFLGLRMFWYNVSRFFCFYQERSFKFLVFLLLKTIIEEVCDYIVVLEMSSLQKSRENSAFSKFVSKRTNFIDS